MPSTPKRKHSKSRRDKRRSQDNLSLPQVSTCKECGSVKMSHRVCNNCGKYKGRQIIEV